MRAPPPSYAPLPRSCGVSAAWQGLCPRTPGADEGRRRAQLTGWRADHAAWDAAVGGWVGG
ncbi:hypothetical protein GCM10009548_34900 [Streptomyces malaysiensis subsp. malaysiensis]